MSSWPIGLQQHLNSANFKHTFGSTTIRSDMDVGPAKVRSRFTDAVDTYQATILLDFDEYETLKDFFKTTLNNGVLPFTFVDPMSEEEGSFRFISPPVISALGGRVFEVTLDWEKIG